MVSDRDNDDDDDDQPTLQRLAPRALVKNDSGVRPALAMPMSLDEAFGFGEETTAVDHIPLGAANMDQTEAMGSGPDLTHLTSPADLEGPTPSLPLDVASLLRRASACPEPPSKPAIDDD